MLLFIISISLFSCSNTADVLSQPPNIPFAKDVIIKKYAQVNSLKFFKYSGKWEVKKVNKTLSIIGTSDEKPAYLISVDKLSNKPKTFKFDFLIKDSNKEYGFIYGEEGIIVRNNKMYPAFFNKKENLLKRISTNGQEFRKGKPEETNTLMINTGYDPLSSSEQRCTIFINESGHTINCPKTAQSFGVYLSENNSITIHRIRWGRGSK